MSEVGQTRITTETLDQIQKALENGLAVIHELTEENKSLSHQVTCMDEEVARLNALLEGK